MRAVARLLPLKRLSLRMSTAATKFVCGDGPDCACYTAEKSLPFPTPAAGPVKHSAKAGETLYLCSCGQSKRAPYCDGSHKAYNTEHGTTFAPFKVEVTEDKDLYLCACGHSSKRPFCDGAHKKVHPAPTA